MSKIENLPLHFMPKNTLNNINNTDEYKDFIYYEG